MRVVAGTDMEWEGPTPPWGVLVVGGSPTEEGGRDTSPTLDTPSPWHQLKMLQGPTGRDWTDPLRGTHGTPAFLLCGKLQLAPLWLSVDLTLVSTLPRGPLCFRNPTKVAQPSSFSTQAAFLHKCWGLVIQIPDKGQLSVLTGPQAWHKRRPTLTSVVSPSGGPKSNTSGADLSLQRSVSQEPPSPAPLELTAGPYVPCKQLALACTGAPPKTLQTASDHHLNSCTHDTPEGWAWLEPEPHYSNFCFTGSTPTWRLARPSHS